ncbi:DegT/DnrJ/EryC1/StrS family aminotransferase [Myxococcota bacterium]
MSVDRVPLLDPKRANETITDGLRQAFERVMQSGRFILGEEVEAFERECASYLGVKNAVGVSSGTDALIVSLMALGIRPGDRVICPTYTFFATAGAVWRAGGVPVFVDSRSQCFNCDPEDVARKLSPDTRAIIPVHLFGQCAEMDAILEVAGAKNIPIIEDAAQAIGAEYEGRRAGGLGKLGCFSFFPSKNLGGFGDAGLVTTDDDELATRLRALRVHGGEKMYDHPEVGGNFRIDALQAALLRIKLPHTDAYAKGRQENAALYHRLFEEKGVAAPGLAERPCADRCGRGEATREAPILLPVACRPGHVYNQYVIRVRGEGLRDRLQAFLAAKNIGCAVYYPKPLHLQPCFAALGHGLGDFPVAEQLARESLALPIFGELTRDEIHHVVDQIAAFVKAEGGA